MVEYRRVAPMPVDAEELMAWHGRPGALERLIPPFEDTRVLDRQGTVHDGGTVTLQMRNGPVRMRWIAQHTDATAEMIRDEQVRGPFRQWVHTHRALPAATGSELEDHVQYRLPLGAVGAAVAGSRVARRIDRMFQWRHLRMQHDLMQLESSRGATWRVAVTGGTGLIGTHLIHLLTTGGHDAQAVPRHRGQGMSWSVEEGIHDPAAWNGLDAVVHLAGESINQRWNDDAKRRIMESRRDGTRNLCEGLAALDEPPKTLISASAVGYYGDAPDPVGEDAEPGKGFLADVVQEWEAAADPARDAGIRVVHSRNGIVLSQDGGALPPLLRVAKLGLGGPIAGGTQPWPWVHIDDVIYAIHHAIATPTLEGPMNVVSPGIVNQKTFQEILGKVLHRPSFMPMPAFQAKLMFGQMGEELFLMGQRAVPRKLQANGFHFAHPDLEEALRFELGRPIETPEAPGGAVPTAQPPAQ